jgi:hypothetical protein
MPALGPASVLTPRRSAGQPTAQAVGFRRTHQQAPLGAEEKRCLFAPLGLFDCVSGVPMARAMGYLLAPLPGLCDVTEVLFRYRKP